MSSTVPSSTSPNRNVRRCLFGRPDPTKTSEWLDERLQEMSDQKKRQWSFNFEQERPVSASSEPEWSWSNMNGDDIPQFYLSRCNTWPATHTRSPIKNEQSKSEQNEMNDEQMIRSRKRRSDEDETFETPGTQSSKKPQQRPQGKRTRTRLNDHFPVAKRPVSVDKMMNGAVGNDQRHISSSI